MAESKRRTRKIPTADAISAYLDSRRARRCSPKYINALTYGLAPLAAAHEHLPTTPEPLEQLLAAAFARGLSDETCFDIWSVLARFYAWAELRLRAVNPMRAVQRPVRRPKEPRVLSDHQLDRILDANERHPRELALIRLLADTGARLGEIARLTWDDIEVGPDGATLHVPQTGKTGARSVPISHDTMRALRRASSERAIWTGRFGPLTYDGVRQVFQLALRRAGMKGNPHLMRHTFGTLYVRAGGDVFSLQRIGGWRNIESVMRYVTLASRDVRRLHEEFSPIARRAAGQGGQQ